MSAAGISQARIRAALVDTTTFFVGLHAPLGVLIERQLAQVDKFGRLAEESMDIHEGWDYDLEIDTQEHSPESAAELLDRYVGALD
jgi:chloramphenicol 3-O-phosphotransferase